MYDPAPGTPYFRFECLLVSRHYPTPSDMSTTIGEVENGLVWRLISIRSWAAVVGCCTQHPQQKKGGERARKLFKQVKEVMLYENISRT